MAKSKTENEVTEVNEVVEVVSETLEPKNALEHIQK